MRDSLQNFEVDNFLGRKLFSCLQGSLLCFHLSNFSIKFDYLCLIVWNLLVEGLLLTEAFLFLGFKFTKLLLACFAKVPLKPHLVKLRHDLKVCVLTMVEVFRKLGEKSFEFNKAFSRTRQEAREVQARQGVWRRHGLNHLLLRGRSRIHARTISLLTVEVRRRRWHPSLVGES